MKQRVCIFLSALHLLGLAICTYIAAMEVESIVFTGWFCSATALAVGIAAIVCKRPVLALAAFVTPLIAVALFILEAFFLHLGPRRAAFPFCIVFVINQIISTLVILVELKLFLSPPSTRRWQVSMRMLLVTMASFSIFFGTARVAANYQHNWMMSTALGLLGLTIVGLVVVMYPSVKDRNAKAALNEIPETANEPKLESDEK